MPRPIVCDNVSACDCCVAVAAVVTVVVDEVGCCGDDGDDAGYDNGSGS